MEPITDQIPDPPFDYQLAKDCKDWFANCKRTWLRSSYRPGSCLVCDEPCDLRAPGTTVAYSAGWPGRRGVPMEVHVGCAWAEAISLPFVEHILCRMLAEIMMQSVWPGARRFNPPDGY